MQLELRQVHNGIFHAWLGNMRIGVTRKGHGLWFPISLSGVRPTDGFDTREQSGRWLLAEYNKITNTNRGIAS